MTSVQAVKECQAFVTKAGESRNGELLSVVGGSVEVKISSRDTGGAFAVMESHTAPMSGPPLHCHPSQDEWWHILQGHYLFEVDGRQIEAGPGDTVFAPRGSHHTFQNIGCGPASSVVTVAPGGLDLFFEEMAPAVPPGTAPDIVALAPLFEKYDLQPLGPPLAERQR